MINRDINNEFNGHAEYVSGRSGHFSAVDELSTVLSMTSASTSADMAASWLSRNRHDAASALALSVAFGALIFFSLVGNSLVCIAIYSNKRLRKVENLYFASMAVADLLLSLLVMPFAASNDVNGRWNFGEYCRIWMSADIVCCTASILHMCAIAFDRYYHIHDPMRYVEKMTWRKVVAAVTLVWTLSAAIGFVPQAFESRFRNALTEKRLSNASGDVYYLCTFNLDPLYAVLSSMISFYLPCAIMIATYTKLYRYARKHVRCMKRQLRAATVTVTANGHAAGAVDALIRVGPNNVDVDAEPSSTYVAAGGLGTPENNATPTTTPRKKDLSDQKARITLGVIMGVFLCCWLPFFVLNIVRSFFTAGTLPPWLFPTLTWLGYANSMANPAIYSIFNRDFRNAFKRILLCQRSNQTNSYSTVLMNSSKSPRNLSPMMSPPRGTTAIVEPDIISRTSYRGPPSSSDKSVML